MSPKFLNTVIWCCVLGSFVSEVAAEDMIGAVPSGDQTGCKNAAIWTSTPLNATTRVQPNSRGLNDTGATVIPFSTSTLSQISVNITNSTGTSALQSYRRYGFAGISGSAVNLENVDYKGEFLYLARNPTDRNASVLWEGGTLAVGEERLGESAFVWEFVPVPEDDNSSFYLRNKLNEQKPLASKQYPDTGRFNYISLEIVSSPEGAQPNQLLVYMRRTGYDAYYHPNSTPNTDSALNGRDIDWDSSRSWAGTEWIVHFSS